MQDLSFSSIRIFYYRFKETTYYPLTMTAVICIISILLFVQIVLPQFSTWFSLQKEIAAVRLRIKTMTENSQFLVRQGEATTTSRFETAKAALPFEKDFAAIYNAITQTAAVSGVVLSDFSFSVGDIAEVAPGGLANLQISLSLKATPDEAKKFITALQSSLPLADVPTWTTIGDSTTLSVRFYYRALPQIPIDNGMPLEALNDEELSTLVRVQSWKPVAVESTGEPVAVSTDSAEGSFYDPL